MERVRGLKERVHIQLEGGMIVRRENKVKHSNEDTTNLWRKMSS